jgi:hypothetical protein
MTNDEGRRTKESPPVFRPSSMSLGPVDKRENRIHDHTKTNTSNDR